MSKSDRALLERRQLHFLLVGAGQRDDAAVARLPAVIPIGFRTGDLGGLPHLHRLRASVRCGSFRSRGEVEGQGHRLLLLDNRSIGIHGFPIGRRLLLGSSLGLFRTALVHLRLGLFGLGLLLLGSALVLGLRIPLGLVRRRVDGVEALVLLDGRLRGVLVRGVGVVREHGHVQEREHQKHRQQD